MGASCLSSASILRCGFFSKVQYLALIIPSGLELIFSVTLIVSNRGSGRKHLLLVVEGWTFLALALLDLLSHILPAARNSMSVFKPLDVFIGLFSFMPLLFYTVFIFLITRKEFIIHLPERFQKVSKYMLFLFIPPIITLNEIASFVGISRGMVNMGLSMVVAIGFKKPKDDNISSFFTSITLALLAAYQGITFFLACYRVMKALVDQRRIETSSSDKNHLFKGTAWIAGGLLLGAIETIIGFAQGGFGEALTRRVLRLLSRACLIIGLAKGMDTLEDFGHLRQDMLSSPHRHRRRSRLRPFISNPRLSTFRKMSPTGATGPPMLQVPDQRVTVHYPLGQAPMLELRFSSLEIPSPASVLDDVIPRPAKEWLRRPCSYLSLPPAGPTKPARPLTIASIEQAKTYRTSVLNATTAGATPPLHRLSLPPSKVSHSPLRWQTNVDNTNSDSSVLFYEGRPRVPSVSSIDTEDLFTRPITPPPALKRMLDRETRRGAPNTFTPSDSATTQASPPDTNRMSVVEYDNFPPALAEIPLSDSRTAQWITAGAQSGRNRHLSTASSEFGAASPAEDSLDMPHLPWTARPASSDDESAIIQHAVSQKAQLARLKSIGRAPSRSTPTPKAAWDAGDSIPVERMVFTHERPSNGAHVDEHRRKKMAYMENGPTYPPA